MAPRYVFPPTRAVREYALTGKRMGAVNPWIRTKKAAQAFVVAYDNLCYREDRICQGCERAYLAAPALRLWVKDRSKPVHATDNLELLCLTCCRKREWDEPE